MDDGKACTVIPFNPPGVGGTAGEVKEDGGGAGVAEGRWEERCGSGVGWSVARKRGAGGGVESSRRFRV